MKFSNNNKKIRSKKGGFTLIEVIATVAVIAILSIMLVPNYINCINKADKTKALDDVRQVVLAIENYSIDSVNKIENNEKFSSIKSKLKRVKKESQIVDIDSIKSIDESMKYETMLELINGKKDFTLKDGKIKVIT